VNSLKLVAGPLPRAPATFVPKDSAVPSAPIMVVSPPLSKSQRAKKRQQMRKQPMWRHEQDKKESEPTPNVAKEPSPKGSAKRPHSEIADENDGYGDDTDESRGNPFEVAVARVVKVTNPVAEPANNAKTSQ